MNDLLPQSCLILEIPEAEAAVGQHRKTLDTSARLGIPAHFTVLFPFMSPDQIDMTILTRLKHLFGSIEAFDFPLAHAAWFGDDVLWLAPEHPDPIRALTTLVHRSFPDFPPFEGKFADVIPHLTIAHGCDRTRMKAAEQAVERCLPVKGHADKVTLMTQIEPASKWTTKAHFPLCPTS